jgi:hypothetical protein
MVTRRGDVVAAQNTPRIVPPIDAAEPCRPVYQGPLAILLFATAQIHAVHHARAASVSNKEWRTAPAAPAAIDPAPPD